MADVVVFHHVLGLTAGLTAFAEDLRVTGHSVATPDLFDGRRFDGIEDGAGHVDEVGIPTLLQRAAAAVEDLPGGLVYCGVSLGVVPAQYLAQTRPGAVGCIAIEAFVAPTEFGDEWPPALPLQVHGMANDPFFAGEGDLDAARSVVDEADDAGGDAGLELFVYPGDRHLFVDRSLGSFDADAAGLVFSRVLEFLEKIDTRI